MKLILFVLICHGATMIIVESNALQFFRDIMRETSHVLGKLVDCTMCTAFWVGLAVATLGYGPLSSAGLDLLMSAFIASGACWVIRVALEALGAEEVRDPD